MELYTDTYYIKRIKDGDVSCFACLIDKYGTQIYSLILKIVGNREDAEELTQDSFMKAFKSIEGFKGDCKFSTWLYRIAYNTAISSTRRQKQELLSIDDSGLENVSEDEIANMFGKGENRKMIEWLDMAIQRLTPDERALILLFYWKEKSIEEISTIMGISIANTKVKLHRIRKRLLILINEMKHE